ncbi:MAG: DUF4412 domain-containing protein [Limisphaerales bacterium]
MKLRIVPLAVLTLSLSFPSFAQQQRRAGGPGGGPGGPPQFSGAMTRLFGENKAFTANAEMEMKTPDSVMTMPGKLAFLDGKSRFEMDATQMKGAQIPPGAAEQMKQMGMAEIISISRPDKKETFIVYPGLKSYAALPAPGESSTADAGKDTLKKTELGKETINGHATTKYKVVMKDDEGKEHESTMWTASDLKDFPIKIETVNEGMPSTITFKDVKFDKPDEALFNPPADFQRYTDLGAMMREQMMKRFAPPAGAALPTE